MYLLVIFKTTTKETNQNTRQIFGQNENSALQLSLTIAPMIVMRVPVTLTNNGGNEARGKTKPRLTRMTSKWLAQSAMNAAL